MARDAYYYVNGEKVYLDKVEGEVAVRYNAVNSVQRGLVSPKFGKTLQTFEKKESVSDGRLTILRSKQERSTEEMKQCLTCLEEVTYVTPVYQTSDCGEKVVLTSKFVCQFQPDLSRAEIDTLNAEHHVRIEAEEAYAPNCFVLRLEDDAAETVLDVANAYQECGKAIFAYPDIISPRGFRTPDPLFAKQWHLKNTGQSGGTPGADIKIEGAWAIAEGRPEVVVAVIDDGVDMDHPDLSTEGKLVAPIDIRSGRADSSPEADYENHGTAVAGVAVASRQGSGITGVAPGCCLMPIRLDGGPILEARAIAYAVQNGAWVINCSWGPQDGAWWDPADPLHTKIAPLPDNVRQSLEYAVTQGRGGKGCVVVWAAGNGNESVSNDGYASYPKVITVSATSHTDQKAAYSDFGAEVSVAAPSNHFISNQAVGGIWTTDRTSGAGYNEGNPAKGDAAGLYANDFGGTSSAAPVVAGIAALMLSVNPTLTAAEVKRILEDTADPVDSAGGQWTTMPDGRKHSHFYGYGRVNAEKAVAEAMRRPGAIDPAASKPASPGAASSFEVVAANTSVEIPDFPAAAAVSKVVVPQSGIVDDLAVALKIEHSWIGDLVISLQAPDGTKGVLQARKGGSSKTLDKVYDVTNTLVLRTFLDKSLQGTWALEVLDASSGDTGRIVSWELRYAATAAEASMGTEVLAAKSTESLPIPDNDPDGVASTLQLSATGKVADIRVDVDITHTYVGDVSVSLVAPSGREVLLRGRLGGSEDNIIESYTPANAPSLTTLIDAGEAIDGEWKLVVRDRASRDTGKLNNWKIAVRKS